MIHITNKDSSTEPIVRKKLTAQSITPREGVLAPPARTKARYHSQRDLKWLEVTYMLPNISEPISILPLKCELHPEQRGS